MDTENTLRERSNEAAVPPPPVEARRVSAQYPNAERWTAPPRPFVADDPRSKSPALATMMSAMPGLGQVYVGYYQQGFTNVLVAAGIITLLNNTGRLGLYALDALLGVFLAFFWLYNMVDAGRRAAFYNQALAGVEAMPLPSDFRLPSGGGTMAGGVTLVVAGLIILSNTMFGLSLEWLEQWWPLGLVGAGAYLIYSSQRDRRERAARTASGTGR